MDPFDQATPAAPGLPDRYQDVEPLGRGAFGLVYRAVDERGRRVAVKVLAADQASRPEAVWQFAGEYRTLARLDHPAFPAAYDEGRTVDGLPYYAMALVEGADLPAGPQEAATVRAVLAGLAEALGYLHGLGLVHGDVKPENLKIDADGRVHLLDVGMMTVVGQAREAIAGTLEYLAPEAFRRQPIDPRADLYALGAVGYQLWTGAPPFEGPPAVLVRAQLTERPADPTPRAPDVDPDLAALLLRLLAKEPAARQQTARAVLAALGRAPEGETDLPGLQGGTLEGRDAALAAWNERLDGLAGDQGQAAPAACVFAGGLGLGKSRLLDECRLAAQVVAIPWVGVSCTGAGDAPMAPLRAVVAQALATAGRRPEADVAAWLAGEVPARLAELEPPSRKAALQALAAQTLADAARAVGGLAIGLDDWHLADAASREMLASLLRALAEAPVRWAIAYDPDEPGATSPADAPLSLAPLTDDEARALLASRLATPVPDALAHDLLPAAQGSPLWLHALLEQAVASGALVRTATGWRYAPAAPTRTASGGLRALWEARLAGASDDARRLAGVAALAVRAGELPIGSLAVGAGLDEARALAAIDVLLRCGVLVAREGRARLAMPAAAPVFADELPADARPAAAARLAADLLGGTPEALAPEAIAALPADRLVPATWLVLAGGMGPAALALATEAGRRALAVAAPMEAMQLLTAASPALAGAPPAAALAFLFARAEAARWLDRLDEAQRDYEEARSLARQVRDGATEARILVGLAKCRQMRGAYDEALAHLERAGELAATLGDRVMHARVAVAEARLRLFRGESGRAVACCDDALAQLAGVDPAAPGAALRAQALNLKGVLVAQEDPGRADEALAMLEEALALAERLGDSSGQGMTLENLGNVYLAIGRLAEAADAFERAATVFEAGGSATDSLGSRLNQAIVAGDLGATERASAIAADVARRSALVGRKFFVAAARAVEGQAAWRAARGAATRAPLDEALAIASEIKNRYLEEHVRVVRLEAWLALGDREAARLEAAALETLVAATGHADAAARLGALRAELARQQGDADAARAQAEELLARPQPVAVHRARQVLAQVALAAGDGATALEHARAARTIARAWRSAWHEAADAWLEVRALGAMGEDRAALSLARIELESPGAAANPFARVGLALALVTHDDGPVARAALDAALASLRPGMLAMASDAWPVALEAQGLAAATGRLERRHEQGGHGAGGGQLDAERYQRALGELAMQTDETAMGQVALREAMALVGAERGYFLAYEDGSLREAITQGLDYEAELADGFSHSIAEEVLFSGNALYIADASTNAAWREAQSVMALGLRTVVCLPVAVPDEILGVLYMDRQAVDPVLAPADMAFLAGFATTVAALILRERRRAAAMAEAAQATTAAALATDLLAARDPDALRQRVLASLVATAGADRGFWLHPARGPERRALAGCHADGRPAPFQPGAISSGIADWVGEHGEPLALLDASALEGWQARQSIQALGLRTVWCLPAPDGGLVYLDTTAIAPGDPTIVLARLEALLGLAAPALP